jgi:hypothetical protein
MDMCYTLNDNRIPLGPSEMNLKKLPKGNQEQAGETKRGKMYIREYGNNGYRLKMTAYGRIEKNGEHFVKRQPTQVKMLNDNEQNRSRYFYGT